jgi:hypothetical protein
MIFDVISIILKNERRPCYLNVTNQAATSAGRDGGVPSLSFTLVCSLISLNLACSNHVRCGRGEV